MFKILFVAAIAAAVGAMLGWISFLTDPANTVYQHLYGKPPAHPHGNTLDHVNDWLNFLPSDPLTRGVIVACAVAGLLTISYFINLLGIRWAGIRRRRQRRIEAKARTISSYHKPGG